jgi:hypothetical protein
VPTIDDMIHAIVEIRETVESIRVTVQRLPDESVLRRIITKSLEDNEIQKRLIDGIKQCLSEKDISDIYDFVSSTRNKELGRMLNSIDEVSNNIMSSWTTDIVNRVKKSTLEKITDLLKDDSAKQAGQETINAINAALGVLRITNTREYEKLVDQIRSSPELFNLTPDNLNAILSDLNNAKGPCGDANCSSCYPQKSVSVFG